MKSVAITFFIISAISLLGTFKFLMDISRPGVYPPKQVLKKRAASLTGIAIICLLFAFLLSYVS